MSIDALFPVPEPTFLFVHQLKIWTTGGAFSVDERGKWKQDTTLPTPDLTPMGYLTAPNETEVQQAGTLLEQVDAVCLVSRTLVIPHSSVLFCNDPRLPINLAGTYKVNGVRTNLSHTRLLCQRLTGVWEQH